MCAGGLFRRGIRTTSEFTGKERDAELANSAGPYGLDYFGARYYSGTQGRFTTADWSATPQAVPYATLEDPQTLNLYSYIRNNPLSRPDFDGHTQCPPMFGFAYCQELVKQAQAAQQAAVAQQNGVAQQQSLSPAGLQFIEQHETLGGQPNLTAYDASGKKHLGDWTIGYGDKIKPSEDFSKGINADQAAGLPRGDVQTAVNAVNNALKYPTTFQSQFDAMVSLAYNIGGGAFANSTLVQRWNGGGVVDQPDLFIRSSRTGGAFSPGLHGRREEEYMLFNTGEYP